MFLPDNTDLVKNLLTDIQLNTIEDDVQDYEYLQENYISKISDLDAHINEAEDDNKALNDKIKKTKDEEKKKELEQEQKDLIKLINAMKKDRNELQKNMQELMKHIFITGKTIPGFFFNLNLAEKVSKANYTPADTFSLENFIKRYKYSPPGIPPDLVLPQPDYIIGTVDIGPDTTDNFGNPLIPGKKYLPVILSFSTDEESQDFTNSLSDFSKTEFFTYYLLTSPIIETLLKN